MATDGQQYGENFSDEQQYSEYNQNNYGEQMEEGGDNAGQEMNGGSNGQANSKPGSDDER